MKSFAYVVLSAGLASAATPPIPVVASGAAVNVSGATGAAVASAAATSSAVVNGAGIPSISGGSNNGVNSGIASGINGESSSGLNLGDLLDGSSSNGLDLSSLLDGSSSDGLDLSSLLEGSSSFDGLDLSSLLDGSSSNLDLSELLGSSSESSSSLSGLSLGGIDLGSVDLGNQNDLLNAIELMSGALCLNNLISESSLSSLGQEGELEMFLELIELMQLEQSGLTNLGEIQSLFGESSQFGGLSSEFSSGGDSNSFNLGAFKRAISDHKKTLSRTKKVRRGTRAKRQSQSQNCAAISGTPGAIVTGVAGVAPAAVSIASVAGASAAVAPIGVAAVSAAPAIATQAVAATATVAAAPAPAAAAPAADDTDLADFTR